MAHGGAVETETVETETVETSDPNDFLWTCSVCTFHNSMLLPYCEICGAEKTDADAALVVLVGAAQMWGKPGGEPGQYQPAEQLAAAMHVVDPVEEAHQHSPNPPIQADLKRLSPSNEHARTLWNSYIRYADWRMYNRVLVVNYTDKYSITTDLQQIPNAVGIYYPHAPEKIPDAVLHAAAEMKGGQWESLRAAAAAASAIANTAVQLDHRARRGSDARWGDEEIREQNAAADALVAASAATPRVGVVECVLGGAAALLNSAAESVFWQHYDTTTREREPFALNPPGVLWRLVLKPDNGGGAAKRQKVHQKAPAANCKF